MQFIKNKIHTGTAKTFEEIVKSYTDKKEVVKTASAAPVVKVAEKDEAPSSGQLKVEPLHQEGESTEATPKVKNTDTKEAPSSGQPEAEAKLNNDPKAETKEAEAKDCCKECNKPGNLCQCKVEKVGDDEEKDEDTEAKAKEALKAASGKISFVKIANLDSKTKNWLSTYWKKLYPADFVDAMLSDK